MGGTEIDCWSPVPNKFLKLVSLDVFLSLDSQSHMLKEKKRIVEIAMGLLHLSSIYSTKTLFDQVK